MLRVTGVAPPISTIRTGVYISNTDSDHLVTAINKLSDRRLDYRANVNAKTEEGRFDESAELINSICNSHVFTLNDPSSNLPF